MEACFFPSKEKIQISEKFRESHAHCVLGQIWADHYQFLGKGQHCELRELLLAANSSEKDIKNKQRGVQSRGVILLQDNARPHTAARTLAKIEDLGWKLLTHPPYSPDLAPSDFHLFGPLKESMRGIYFQIEEEVKAAVSKLLRTQSTEFYAKGIDDLISRWNKCVAKEGD